MAKRIVKASEFKARCLKLRDEVAERPPIEQLVRGFFRRNRGQIVIHGDLDDFKRDWAMRD